MKSTLSILIFILLTLASTAQQVYTLEQCHKMALEKNKNILIASEKIEVANEMRKAAFTQYLPSVSANGTYMWNEKNISLLSEDQYLPVGTKMTDGSFGFTQEQVNNSWTILNGKPVPLDANGQPFNPKVNPEKILWKNYAYIPKEAFEFDAQNIYAAAITLTQPLFLGGKIYELNKIAGYSQNLAKAAYEGEISETLLSVDETYWRIVSLQYKEQMFKSYQQLLQKLDTNMQYAIQMGVATRSESLSVKVKLNEANMMLLKIQDGIALSKMSLCQQCGIDYPADYSLKDESDFPKTQTNLVMKEPNLQNRFEIKSLEQLYNISESNRKIAMSRFMPNIGLTGSYLITNPNMYNGFNDEFSGMWQVGIAVNIPIFHFGDRYFTLKAANAEKHIAELRLDEAKEKIKLEFSQAQFKIDEASKKMEVSFQNLINAEENLRLANEGFEAGTITSTTVMEAQTAWLKAKSEQIDAQIDMKLCETYLSKAVGNLK